MDSINDILSQIKEFGPVLPGSVRRTFLKHKSSDGEIQIYETMPIYTWTDSKSGRQICKRIGKKDFDTYKSLTDKYSLFKKLLRELDDALRLAYEPCNDGKKKPKRKM